jgi:hypothetical protein
MNKLTRHTLAAGAGLALAMGGGAAGFAQSQSSATQTTPAQTQPSPAAQSDPQSNQAQPGTAANTQPAGTQSAANQAAPAHRTLQLVEVKAELSSSLDAKKAKEGQPVTAKLQDDVQVPDAQALPKNTVLEGHVDQVQASENKGDSSVVVTFDKARLKDGQELPIKATVVAMHQPVNLAAENQGGMPAAAAGPGMSGGSMAPSGGGSSSGMGRAGGASPSTPNTGSEAQSMPNQAAGSQQGGASQGIPGVMLKSDIHQHSSATFMATGRNVKVPDDTQLEVAIAVIPAGVSLQ